MFLLLHISHMEIFANWRACWSSVLTKYEKLVVLDCSLIRTDGPSCSFGDAHSSDVGISRELVGGIDERKSWSAILSEIVPSRTYQPTQIARTKLLNKQIVLISRRCICFYLSLHCELAMILSHFGCTPIRTRMETQRRVLIVWSVENWARGALYVYNFYIRMSEFYTTWQPLFWFEAIEEN